MMVNGAEDRNRTGTVITNRRILSPVRLPVPPPRRIIAYQEQLIYYHINFSLSTPFFMERVMGIEPT